MNKQQLSYARALRREYPDAITARKVLMFVYNDCIDREAYRKSDWYAAIDSAVFTVTLSNPDGKLVVEWDEEAFEDVTI